MTNTRISRERERERYGMFLSRFRVDFVCSKYRKYKYCGIVFSSKFLKFRNETLFFPANKKK